MTVDGRTWMELMTPPECWAALADHRVGRVAMLGGHGPEIYPVNYAVDGRSIVFRTERGSKLEGLLRWPSVAFEIDHIDPLERSGWSVLVKGQAREVTAAGELATVRRLVMEVWAIGEKPHWVRIVPDEVTGRRLYRT